MPEDSYFIQPEFAHKAHGRHRKRIESVSEQSEDTPTTLPKVKPPVPTPVPAAPPAKDWSDTFREHKMLILVLAVIVILLVCLLVWTITSKNDKREKVQLRKSSAPALPPPPEQHMTQMPTPQMPTPQISLNMPQPMQQRMPALAPTPHNVVQPPAKKTQEPPTPSHESVIHTTDDDELNKYMNLDKDDIQTDELDTKE
jgi:hypothetical protein